MKTKQIIHTHSVISKPMCFDLYLSAKQAKDILVETERICKFCFESWNRDSGKAVIRLTPMKGIVEYENKTETTN